MPENTANNNITGELPETAAAAAPAALKGQPVVYMLRCRDDSLYTGWTNDFSQRLAAHQSGKGGKYTRSRLPVEPVYLERLADKSTALRREAAIKRLSPERKRALLRAPENELAALLHTPENEPEAQPCAPENQRPAK